MSHFGEQLKQKFLENLNIEFTFKGCTEDEIELVKEFQHISYIPVVYRDLLRTMGHSALEKILMGDANWEQLKNMKQSFVSLAKRTKLAYPQDILVFYDDLGSVFYFFRTKDYVDDPPVYGYPVALSGPVESRLARLSDSISEFFLSKLETYINLVRTRKEVWDPYVRAYYDPNQDEFYLTSE